MAADGSGDAYVTGETDPGFPVTPSAFQTAPAATETAFVTEINPQGTALVFSTFLGGSFGESGMGIAVDSSGAVYVAGATQSTDFPVTPGAFQMVNNARFLSDPS